MALQEVIAGSLLEEPSRIEPQTLRRIATGGEAASIYFCHRKAFLKMNLPKQRVGRDGERYACRILFDWEDGERQETTAYLTFGSGRFQMETKLEKEPTDFQVIVSKYPRWLLGFVAWFRVSTDGAIVVSRRDIKCMSDALPFVIRIRPPGPLDFIIFVEITDGSVHWSEFARVVFSE